MSRMRLAVAGGVLAAGAVGVALAWLHESAPGARMRRRAWTLMVERAARSTSKESRKGGTYA